jgi:predicted alpha-1,2-mannosidase
MKIQYFFSAFLTAFLGSIYCFAQEGASLLDYVQPLAGTAASTTAAAQKHSEASSEQYANTIPSVATPFAMTQWTPQTRKTEEKCVAPYYYTDSLINGFRATHWLSGSCTQDYGSFTVMPVSGALALALKKPESLFTHENEVSSPAHYQVKLDRYNLQVEMTGSARAGMMQVTALVSDSVYLLINANSDEAEGDLILDGDAIIGTNPVHRIYQGWGEYAGFDGHFFMLTDKKARISGTFKKDKIIQSKKIRGDGNAGVYIGFYLKKGERISIKMGTSFTSTQNAYKNLLKEIPDWNFSTIQQETKEMWELALSKVKISHATDQQNRVFYTSLYHAMQHPRLFNDVDGQYPAFASKHTIKVSKSDYYDDFSMWDIYRAQIPLLEILKPTLVNDLVSSLVDKGRQGGWLPIFPCWNSYTAAMIGDHTASVIASAYKKGIRDFDVEEAYRLMYKNAFMVADSLDYYQGKGRRGLQSYLRYGYIPMEDSVPIAFHKKEQVSRTLEYAYDDYALAMFASALGKSADYNKLLKRAKNYQLIFDKQVGMVRGRYEDGSWYKPFHGDQREPYITEGTPHQYTFYVPQDIPGLAKLMGGRQALEKNLDQLFAGGGYWHGNEPGHQIPFLYNYTGAPWKTQEQVRQILKEEYSDGPGGLSGNDDAGQMSAWYVFAALGFYPVNPLAGEYQLTTPLYQIYQINLPGNKAWKVRCDRSPVDYPYIQSVQLNGASLARNYITYEELMKGGEMEFKLGKTPNKQWGVNKNNQSKGL